jgi:MoaA/NifB/PqqE/SkfB family radical SAM enzyme
MAIEVLALSDSELQGTGDLLDHSGPASEKVNVRVLSTLLTNFLCRLNEITNRNFILPLLIYYPTSRCNSRCISCDWWKSTGEDDLTLAEISGLASQLGSLRTKMVLFSGGEPLLRRDVFPIARVFRNLGIDLWLLTSGVLLPKYVREVADHFQRVTISLDAGDAGLYQKIRGIDGLTALQDGVRELKKLAPEVPVTGRATIHKVNFSELRSIVGQAKVLGLDAISFLPADVSSDSFGRSKALPKNNPLVLTQEDLRELNKEIGRLQSSYPGDFASGYIAEQPDKLRRLVRYYGAVLEQNEFPTPACNAPWVSVVVEANGDVRPCYFHQVVGNIRHKPLAGILREELRSFRRGLDVDSNPVCRRCVCSLKVGLGSRLW